MCVDPAQTCDHGFIKGLYLRMFSTVMSFPKVFLVKKNKTKTTVNKQETQWKMTWL